MTWIFCLKILARIICRLFIGYNALISAKFSGSIALLRSKMFFNIWCISYLLISNISIGCTFKVFSMIHEFIRLHLKNIFKHINFSTNFLILAVLANFTWISQVLVVEIAKTHWAINYCKMLKEQASSKWKDIISISDESIS